MDYEEAMEVLRGWSGHWVTVVAFVEPGVSLRPLSGFLSCEDGAHHILRATIDPPGTRIAFPIGTKAAVWFGQSLPGRWTARLLGA